MSATGCGVHRDRAAEAEPADLVQYDGRSRWRWQCNTRAPLAELETRLDEIRSLAAEADASSREALLHCVDGLFRFVDQLQAAEQLDAPVIRALPR
ncbi:hypothetical protein [Burkholderia pyrrocinia]|uniref:hypothetical protein n=1 Tax=Burkholderia pyrrocinia TaxID=60550 RepID=UPI002AB03C54|nr:hypothetical protein [Burkholderia pyrrocinia]